MLWMMRGGILLILGHGVKGQGQLWHSVYKTLWTTQNFYSGARYVALWASCLIIGFKICKISFNSCIELNHEHRVCPSTVMAQNTEYFGCYGYSQLHCDVTPTLRMLCDRKIIWAKQL